MLPAEFFTKLEEKQISYTYMKFSKCGVNENFNGTIDGSILQLQERKKKIFCKLHIAFEEITTENKMLKFRKFIIFTEHLSQYNRINIMRDAFIIEPKFEIYLLSTNFTINLPMDVHESKTL